MGASLYEPINVFKPLAPDIGIVDGPFEYLTVGGVRLSLPFTTHLFRDGAATFWAIKDPVRVRGVSGLLGHEPRMTERYYNQANAMHAGRKLADALGQF